MMVTITDAIKHAVAARAGEIHRIKSDALLIQELEELVCVSPDGKTLRKGRPTREEYAAGWRMAGRKLEKVVSHISPRHPSWGRYKSAKRQASLLLTARLLLKLGGGSVPDLSQVRREVRKEDLNHHARRRAYRSVVNAAFRYLRKLDNRLRRAPDRFAVVETWLAARTPAESANV
jgi:hypothetical protein